MYSSVWQIPIYVDAHQCGEPNRALGRRTGVEDANADFMGPRRSDLDLFNFEGLSSTPTNSGFALDWFTSSIRHNDGSKGEGEVM